MSETALQDALVASAIGDNGTIMKPHLMANIVSDVGQVVDSYTPTPWLKATSPSTAKAVRTLMLGVTSSALRGTAAGVFTAPEFPPNTVAAKTGTAETVNRLFGGLADRHRAGGAAAEADRRGRCGAAVPAWPDVQRHRCGRSGTPSRRGACGRVGRGPVAIRGADPARSPM